MDSWQKSTQKSFLLEPVHGKKSTIFPFELEEVGGRSWGLQPEDAHHSCWSFPDYVLTRVSVMAECVCKWLICSILNLSIMAIVSVRRVCFWSSCFIAASSDCWRFFLHVWMCLWIGLGRDKSGRNLWPVCVRARGRAQNLDCTACITPSPPSISITFLFVNNGEDIHKWMLNWLVCEEFCQFQEFWITLLMGVGCCWKIQKIVWANNLFLWYFLNKLKEWFKFRLWLTWFHIYNGGTVWHFEATELCRFYKNNALAANWKLDHSNQFLAYQTSENILCCGPRSCSGLQTCSGLLSSTFQGLPYISNSGFKRPRMTIRKVRGVGTWHCLHHWTTDLSS